MEKLSAKEVIPDTFMDRKYPISRTHLMEINVSGYPLPNY
jgi:hypothetical protein